MKILIDENIPYAESFFCDLGEVERFAGRELTPAQLVDVDVLLVRSITKVNAELLTQANRLKFVGTATIGEDHIDKQLLAQKGIYFTSAPGCNANSVAEFVINVMLVLAETHQLSLSDKVVSIIGVGNIGSRLKAKLDVLNIELRLCDPFKSGAEFVSLEKALKEGDIISFHTPLTKEGEHPTFHLLNEHNLALLKDDVCLINASRGEVIDNKALLAHIEQRKTSNRPAIKLALDVWEGEPEPLVELIPHSTLCSAHIAGYSLEGKAKGTEILYRHVCEQFGFEASHQLQHFLPEADITEVSLRSSGGNGGSAGNAEQLAEQSIRLEPQALLKTLIHLVFDVRRDDALFHRHLANQGFDWIRKNYPVRREWSSLTVKSDNPNLSEKLTQLGFNTESIV